MSATAQDPLMKKVGRVADVEALIREIQRYLAYVDAFRSLRGGAGRPPQKPEGKSES